MKFEIEKFNACKESIVFRKNYPDFKTAWENCHRGDWMLWIAKKLNVDLLKLTTAKALCANTVRNLMRDERSTKAIDVAILFGQGKASREELDAAAAAAADADAIAYTAYTAYTAADAAAVAADYNGCPKASHVKDKIIEMQHLNETLFACGIACSALGTKTEAGNFLIDLLLANVCKQNVTRFPYEIVRLAEDIAGGLMVTAPSEKDLRDPKIGPYIDKYLRGVNNVSTENRLKILRLIENLSLGTAAVGYRTESMHGAGSPQAQRIMISRQGNLRMKKALAKAIAHIEE